MHEFRIIQTRPLTSILPYEVEQSRQVWYLPWPIWRSMQERVFGRDTHQRAPRRFQTTTEAQHFIEMVMQQYAYKQAEQERGLAEQRQRKHVPRVVQVFSAPVAG
jgi:hypothetical protein